MKKSEMIQKLKLKLDNWDIISGKNSMFCWDDSEPITLKEVEEILDFLISEGMLPPTTNLSKLDANDNAWDEED